MEDVLYSSLEKLNQVDKYDTTLAYLNSEWLYSVEDLNLAASDEKVWSNLKLPVRLKIELVNALSANIPTYDQDETNYDYGASSTAVPTEDQYVSSSVNGEWTEYYSVEHNCSYYCNTITGESQWELPEGYYDSLLTTSTHANYSEKATPKFLKPKHSLSAPIFNKSPTARDDSSSDDSDKEHSPVRHKNMRGYENASDEYSNSPGRLVKQDSIHDATVPNTIEKSRNVDRYHDQFEDGSPVKISSGPFATQRDKAKAVSNASPNSKLLKNRKVDPKTLANTHTIYDLESDEEHESTLKVRQHNNVRGMYVVSRPVEEEEDLYPREIPEEMKKNKYCYSINSANIIPSAPPAVRDDGESPVMLSADDVNLFFDDNFINDANRPYHKAENRAHYIKYEDEKKSPHSPGDDMRFERVDTFLRIDSDRPSAAGNKQKANQIRSPDDHVRINTGGYVVEPSPALRAGGGSGQDQFLNLALGSPVPAEESENVPGVSHTELEDTVVVGIPANSEDEVFHGRLDLKPHHEKKTTTQRLQRLFNKHVLGQHSNRPTGLDEYEEKEAPSEESTPHSVPSAPSTHSQGNGKEKKKKFNLFGLGQKSNRGKQTRDFDAELEENILQLSSMGFTEDESIAALASCDNNVVEATALLLNSKRNS